MKQKPKHPLKSICDAYASISAAKLVNAIEGHCYYNALRYVAKKNSDNVLYVEGYSIHPDMMLNNGFAFATKHAWVLEVNNSEDSTIVDPTAAVIKTWNATYHPVFIYPTALLREAEVIGKRMSSVSSDAGELFRSRSIWLVDDGEAHNYMNTEERVLLGFQKETCLSRNFLDAKLGWGHEK